MRHVRFEMSVAKVDITNPNCCDCPATEDPSQRRLRVLGRWLICYVVSGSLGDLANKEFRLSPVTCQSLLTRTAHPTSPLRSAIAIKPKIATDSDFRSYFDRENKEMPNSRICVIRGSVASRPFLALAPRDVLTR